MQTDDPPTRLIPFQEFKRDIGIKSDTTLYKLIREGDVPQPITRGRNKFFTDRDRQEYVAKLAKTREVA